MKITRSHSVSMSVGAFAEQHGLAMKVHKRTDGSFSAEFEGAEVRRGTCMLLSMSGEGFTEELAISDYAQQLSGQLMIVDALRDTRREIWVPQLTGEWKEG